MMEESATACVSGDFAQALEKAKEAVSTALLSIVSRFCEPMLALFYLGGK